MPFGGNDATRIIHKPGTPAERESTHRERNEAASGHDGLAAKPHDPRWSIVRRGKNAQRLPRSRSVESAAEIAVSPTAFDAARQCDGASREASGTSDRRMDRDRYDLESSRTASSRGEGRTRRLATNSGDSFASRFQRSTEQSACTALRLRDHRCRRSTGRSRRTRDRTACSPGH